MSNVAKQNTNQPQNSAYQSMLSKIVDKLNEARVVPLRKFWEIGKIVNEIVSQRKKYGDHTVEQIATDINWPKGKTMLYYFMRIAKFFSEKDLEKFIEAGGSVSHAIRIVEAPDEGKMKILYDKFIEEGLSARDIQKMIKSWSGEPAPVKQQLIPPVKFVSLCEKFIDTLNDIKTNKEYSKELSDDIKEDLKQILRTLKEEVEWLLESL